VCRTRRRGRLLLVLSAPGRYAPRLIEWKCLRDRGVARVFAAIDPRGAVALPRRRAFRFLQSGIACGEAAECHIDDSLVFIRADISRTTHDKELLRELRTLLASCRDRSVSRWTSTATGRARRHSVRVGTNPNGLCYLRGRATSDKTSNANCQSQGEHCSHKCAPPCTFRLIDFFAPFYPATIIIRSRVP
jgi:hypothetical protein